MKRLLLIIILLLFINCTKKVRFILKYDHTHKKHYLRINYIAPFPIGYYSSCDINLDDPNFIKKTNMAM